MWLDQEVPHTVLRNDYHPNDIEDVHNTETRSEYLTIPRKEGLTMSQHELFLPSVLTN